MTEISDQFETLILNLHDIGCQNRCIFCRRYSRSLNRKRADRIAREQIAKLKNFKGNQKAGLLIISGNDPLEYYDFVNFLKEIKKRTAVSVFLQSNCLDLANKVYLEKILDVGNIGKIQIPIYGHNAKIHDSITGNKGSFSLILKAIKNLEKIGFRDLLLHSLFLKQNEKHLLQFFNFLLKFGYPADASLVSLPSYRGRYSKKVLGNAPDLSLVRDLFKNKISRILNKNNLFLHDIPFCLAPGIKNISFRNDSSCGGYDHFAERKIDKVFINNQIWAAYRSLSKPHICRQCLLFDACRGIALPYLELKLFKPLPYKKEN